MADLIVPTRGHTLVDILDRVLDKGLVIAGDIKVNLANVELLTIQIRLLVCSIDKAEQIGMDWWRHDPRFSSRGQAVESGATAALPAEFDARLARIERQLSALVGEGKKGGKK